MPQERRLWTPRNLEVSQIVNAVSHCAFITCNRDIGRTTLVEHRISLIKGLRPLQLPLHRLRAIKEAEVEQQVNDVLRKGRIESAGDASSFPVVLINKKAAKWQIRIDYLCLFHE